MKIQAREAGEAAENPRNKENPRNNKNPENPGNKYPNPFLQVIVDKITFTPLLLIKAQRCKRMCFL
jgi:hypothetical protein